MRNVTFAVVLMVGGVAGAQGPKAKDAVAGAKAALDKADEAFNAHDAKAMAAMLDKSYFGVGPFISAKQPDVEAARAAIEQQAAAGGHLTRDGLTLKTDEDGDTAWYIADYTFVPKVPPGVLAIHRKLREAGVLVRHGKEWKLAMRGVSWVQPDPPTPVRPAGAPATP